MSTVDNRQEVLGVCEGWGRERSPISGRASVKRLYCRLFWYLNEPTCQVTWCSRLHHGLHSHSFPFASLGLVAYGMHVIYHNTGV